MLSKEYGNTGKRVSAIGFGGMRFANASDIDASAEIVLHAYRQGITYFDTAPYYCDDHSEDIFGAAIRQMKRGTFFVSTKCMDSDGGQLRASLERSLTRLGVEKIDFFHIWCVLDMKGWQSRKDGGALAAAIKARDEGLIEHLVVSSHMCSEDLKGMLSEGHFDGITLGYCAINYPYRLPAVEFAHKMGLGVVAMNSLGGGIIPQNANRLAFLQGEGDRSVVEGALRFVVSTPGVSTALVGFSNKQQVDQAVEAVRDFRPYSSERIAAVRQNIEQSFDGLCTGCGYCLPCPKGVPIPQLMDVYNQTVLGSPSPAEIDGRVEWHWHIPLESGAACSLCGACEKRCTQHLDIRRRLTELNEKHFPAVQELREERARKAKE